MYKSFLSFRDNLNILNIRKENPIYEIIYSYISIMIIFYVITCEILNDIYFLSETVFPDYLVYKNILNI